jgi:hypothetical protein
MDVTADLQAPCDPATLFAWVDDLERYPQWLSIVPRAVRDRRDDAPDEPPAWRIDLRGRIGPLARSKRLRMVRTTLDAPNLVVFERDERDGHQHSAWVLRAAVEPHADGARLTMHLHYGGRLWEPLVERLLRDEIAASKQRLLALVGSASGAA